MIFKNIFAKKKNKNQSSTVFVLKAQLSFRTAVQVAYKDENGNVKIVRFFSDSWAKEVLSHSGKVADLAFKIFVHTPNLSQQENLSLTIMANDKMILTKEFSLDQRKDYAGWFNLE